MEDQGFTPDRPIHAYGKEQRQQLDQQPVQSAGESKEQIQQFFPFQTWLGK